MARLALAGAFIAISAGAAGAACPAGSTIRDWVSGGNLCLAAATYGVDPARPTETLVVVLHGDVSSGGPADYHFAIAEKIAQPGVAAVALLRPGYADKAGRTSQGSNNDRSDSYTAVNIDAVAAAVEALKKQYQPRRTLVLGHSGGAAITGVLLGKNPGLFQGAVLMSCPCDLVRWRKEVGRRAWTKSLSPSDYVAKTPISTTVVAITGTADDNTSVGLGRDYVAALAKRGVPARFEAVEGAGHNSVERMQGPAIAALKAMMGP